MTTLYEHGLLGPKISMISTEFNIPFLQGSGNICLYERGITLLDAHGNERYIIELDSFSVSYERFLNIRNLKPFNRHVTFVRSTNFKYHNIKNSHNRVKGVFYGKLLISIPKIGDIVLLDNQSSKYKNFYDKVQLLKNGINPLYGFRDIKKNSIMNIFKSKFNRNNKLNK